MGPCTFAHYWVLYDAGINEKLGRQEGQDQRGRLLANENFDEFDRWYTQLGGTGVKVETQA